ncbi:MAG: Uma2 family endonuclease [Anaerolineae bacterium]
MVARTRLTAAEYHELPETTQSMQLIDGEVILSPSPEIVHQRTSRSALLYLETRIPNGELLYAPMDVEFDEHNTPQPALFWISEGSRCVPAENGKYYVGAPDLIVELLSPGTALQDRRDKFRLYERHGVREYWIIDPHERLIESWSLVDQKYVRIGVFGDEDKFTSPLLGEIEVAKLLPRK